jgi:pyruvate dehydrogenase E1 component
MASLFRRIGIYSPAGQLYTPEDDGSMLSYKKSKTGQLLEEGITEAGALSSWVAAATAYSVHGVTMLPFYIYYSMFGFQRVGDLIWAAADQRSRGFLLGATAGRTTLGGEGLQHQDGASHLIASTVPNCRAYDPAFAGELAVILDHGARCMLEQNEGVFYYITVMNENYPQPSLPSDAAASVIRGMYRFSVTTQVQEPAKIRLLGSGAIFREVLAAAQLLLDDRQVSAEIWSVTSFSELAREARCAERWNRLHPLAGRKRSFVAECLDGPAPVIAATDYVCGYPDLIARFIDAQYVSLGTDGFGGSDNRIALRRFFEVDRHHVAIAALQALTETGAIKPDIVEAALAKYAISAELTAPWLR